MILRQNLQVRKVILSFPKLDRPVDSTGVFFVSFQMMGMGDHRAISNLDNSF